MTISIPVPIDQHFLKPVGISVIAIRVVGHIADHPRNARVFALDLSGAGWAGTISITVHIREPFRSLLKGESERAPIAGITDTITIRIVLVLVRCGGAIVQFICDTVTVGISERRGDRTGQQRERGGW
jgi:hypothetical protein